MAGPLTGIRIVEFAGIGPGPFCGMMLSDNGAEVIRIDRPGTAIDPRDPTARGHRSLVLNTKTVEGREAVRALCRTVDGIIEGFRPGVMERLGLGPEVLLKDNPRLVYGRMTGWGQSGPLAHAAGHDINYISISGVLHTIGVRGQKPVPPVNYVGDYGGGGMLLAFGMVSALLAVRNGAPGQVIDAAMTDGSALLASMNWFNLGKGAIQDTPGVNRLDGGAHFYDTYECADGRWISVGAIEPQFYALLRERAGLTDEAFDAQLDVERWPCLKEKLAQVIRSRTRDAWSALLEGTDACVAPVLSLREAPLHPHNIARGTFIEMAGVTQPAPAPRYSVTENPMPSPAPVAGSDGAAILASAGLPPDEIALLRASGILG